MGESRDIYISACREIATELQAYGFRSLKTGPYLIKREADLTFRIRFQSDFRNALSTTQSPGTQVAPDQSSLFISPDAALAEIAAHGSVSLFVHAEIMATSVKSWRAGLAHPVRTDAGVAGANIGYLAPERQWLNINLANPRSRSVNVKAVSDLIKSVALPYFEEFRYPERVVASLIDADNPGMGGTMDIEYSACYGSIHDALRVLERRLRRAPDYIHAEYQEALQTFRRNGLPAPNTVIGKGGYNFAFAALALGLEPIA